MPRACRGRQGREIPDRLDPEVAQHRRGLLAHAPQARDRQRCEERGLVARWHDDEPVRLAQVRADLRDELGGRHADRCGEPHLGVDRVLDRARDRLPVTEQLTRPGDVEKRLVDRDRLDGRREPPEDRHHLAARLLVAAAVDWQEDPLGAQAAGGPQRHRRVDAELAGLVACGTDDAPLVGSAATDDHRLAAERRVVALLDRGEERIEVDVEDRQGRGAHARDSLAVTCHRAGTTTPESKPPGAANGPGGGLDGRCVSPWARRRS